MYVSMLYLPLKVCNICPKILSLKKNIHSNADSLPWLIASCYSSGKQKQRRKTTGNAPKALMLRFIGLVPFQFSQLLLNFPNQNLSDSVSIIKQMRYVHCICVYSQIFTFTLQATHALVQENLESLQYGSENCSTVTGYTHTHIIQGTFKDILDPQLQVDHTRLYSHNCICIPVPNQLKFSVIINGPCKCIDTTAKCMCMYQQYRSHYRDNNIINYLACK